MIITTKGLSPAELIEAVSLRVGGPHGTDQFSPDQIIELVKDLLAELEPREITILNGPNHGLKFETVEETGITLNMPATISLCRYPEDADIRYAHPTFMDQYFIQGDYAYYIGQRIRTGQLGMPHLDAENIR